VSPEREFARRFAEAWAHPTPDGLVALLHDDVVLYQPHMPPIRGKEAARAEFVRLLRWLPELSGEVERSAGADDLLFIEWRMRVPVGGGTYLRAVDRFFLHDGLAAERIVYFDQQRLAAIVATHPQLWPGFVKYRFGK
jgi:hypothetical protein